VLTVVDAENPSVAVARERVNEAYAQWDRAEALWLPSLRAGVNYNKHEGRIQDVVGQNIETSRGAFYSGLGANAVGAASPAIPGVYANFHLSDAIFQPKIAEQIAAARQASAQATSNDYLLYAAQAYLELLRAHQERAIAREVAGHARQLSELTKAYADSGEGLESDYDRARTEAALRENELLRAEEAVRSASARLAQLLSLDPAVVLEPQEPAVAPLELIDDDSQASALVAQALTSRPEVQESQSLVCEAVRRLQREQYAPLVPSLLLGVSYGGFGAGVGGNISGYADRFDGDAVAWWEMRNLGLGESAARREMSSRVDQARLRQVALLDQIAREVVEAQAQVELRRKQIDTAKEGVKVASGSYAKNLDRIQNAEGLPLEALQSMQALGQAQRDYLRAVTDYNLAQFSLVRAIGQPPHPLPQKVKEADK
jgi:outer membrane protein TolC